MFDFQFLGTSAGIPTKTRNVTALAIGQTASKPWLLVDCGEATQQQLLHTPWSANTLSAICITHVHGDHCYGLPGMLASAGLNKRTHPAFNHHRTTTSVAMAATHHRFNRFVFVV